MSSSDSDETHAGPAAGDSHYEVVVLGPEAARLISTFEQILSARLTDIGMPRQSVKVLPASRVQERSGLPCVGTYLGGEKPGQEDTVHALLEDAIEVVPVVVEADLMNAHVPPALHPINAIIRDSSTPSLGLEAVVAWVLERLGLIPGVRRCFLSYRRMDSREIALQLNDALSDRGWRVFLDTHSLDPGVEFQSHLHDALAGTDVVVLLDSPNALESRWVREEVLLADSLRVGVLQILWPNRRRAPETIFATPVTLMGSPDFLAERLSPGTVQRICEQVEALRARSVSARRARLMRLVVRRARKTGIETQVCWPNYLLLSRETRSERVVPLVGHPSLDDFYAAARKHTGHKMSLVYDPRELLVRRRDIMQWQDDHPEIDLVQTVSIDSWLAERFA